MRKSLGFAAALTAIALLGGATALAQEGTGTGVVRDLSTDRTAGTVYVLTKLGTIAKDVVPGTRMEISDLALRFTNILAGDKVQFQFQPEGSSGLSVTSLSRVAAGTTITTNVVVGIDVIANSNGNLDVGAGQILTIRNGAILSGNIDVRPGGTLIVTEDATINGNIVGSGGADILVDVASVNGNVENLKSPNKTGLLAISRAEIRGNVTSVRNLFLGMELSSVFGSFESRTTILTGVLDSVVTGNVYGTNVDLFAAIGNMIDGDLNVNIVTGAIIVTNNIIDGNLMITNAAICLEELDNTVNGTNFGCSTGGGDDDD